MRKIISILAISISAEAITNTIIADADFTNWNEFPLESYEAVFGGKISRDRIRLMYTTPRYYGFNPLVLFVLAQRESGQFSTPSRHIEDYFLGAWIHFDASRKTNTFKPFVRQVWLASWRLMYWYDRAAENKYLVQMLDDGKYHTMPTKGTFALSMYTPIYCKAYIFGKRKDYFGNFTYRIIYTNYHDLLTKATRKP